MGVPDVSIVIPTLNREQELAECLESLSKQVGGGTYECIILRQRGPLAILRNLGLRQARAPVVSFLDDDILCAPTWLAGVRDAFTQPGVVGVTGPARIPDTHRSNRDLYKYPRLRRWYDQWFVGDERRPGHITWAGTFVPDPDWSYEGPVQYLEACNMSFKTEAIKAIGGFDEAYGGVGDWSEPDLAFRLRSRHGDDCLSFYPDVAVEHRCSRSGAFLLRGADARQRLWNYELFARRWVRPSWRHWLYRVFLTAYYRGYHGCLNRRR